MKQKRKATRVKVSPQKKQKFSSWVIFGIIILFISLFIIVVASGHNQSLQGNAADAIVAPTFETLGDCQTNGKCPKASPGVTKGANPVPSTVISANPSTESPCVSQDAENSIMAKHRHYKGGKGGNNNSGGGFFQFILQFLQQLLQLLQQLLGGGTTTPTNPGTPVPSQGVQPSGTPNPGSGQSPCPPSGVPQPSSAPSSAPAPSAAPVTSSSCTNPKYTITMDPNDAQKGVTIGNFYLTADTWNAGNYQLSQTVYACDYNNWYAVATMNNNNGDGAVKTSPNVHEDINKSLSSLKTISSTFAESGPHVGIYEYEYDVWLNGFDNGSTEVMIWVDNFGQTPSGSKQGTFTDNGHTYDVYSTGSGYVAFVAQSNFTSGTVNIQNFLNYVVSKGWAATSSTLSQVDFGVELVSTNNAPATFKVTNFSLTAN